MDARFDTPRDINPAVPPALSNLIMESISTPRSKRPRT